MAAHIKRQLSVSIPFILGVIRSTHPAGPGRCVRDRRGPAGVQGIIKKRSFDQVSRIDKSQVLYQPDSAKYKAAYDNAKQA